jgi:hypothetical protein
MASSIVETGATKHQDLLHTQPTGCDFGDAPAELISLERWQEFVESRPESTPFHHSYWINLLQEQYGFPIFIPAIIRQGAVAAALPFALTRSILERRKLLSLPFTDALPILAVDSAAADALRSSIGTLLSPKCKTVIQRTDWPAADGAAEYGWYRHELDIPTQEDLLKDGRYRNVRRDLRRGEKHGLTYEHRADLSAISSFYDLHARNRRRLGVPVQPRSFFARFYERVILRGLGFVGVVSIKDKVIATAVFLSYNKTVIYKYSASDFNAWEHHPNDFLIGSVLCDTMQHGSSCLDFGITPVNQAGLLRFKRKWATREIPVGFACYAGSVNQFSNPSRLLTFAAPIIRHSPLMICRMMGDLLYKYSS